jgi:hypothetical protein
LASIPYYIEKAEDESSVLAEWGTAVTVNSLEIIRKSGQIKKLGLSREDRFIHRNEYIIWLLLQLGKIQMADIKHCGQAFDLVDSNHDEKLDLAIFDQTDSVTNSPPPMTVRRGMSTRELSAADRAKRDQKK